MKFYLGTHRPHWLGLLDFPLFVSNRTLSPRRTFPRARAEWALDSGGFSELSMFGDWVTSPAEYVRLTRRYMDEIGKLEWAAPQDWMCEPMILAQTGLSIETHQLRTIVSYLHLNTIAPDIPWIPVLQGWELDDYLDHIDQYARFGIDLTNLPLVGVGSVCRRQNTDEAREIFEGIHDEGISIHGFGVKKTGLRAFAHAMASTDSMAWSFRGRRDPLPTCAHNQCQNCIVFAQKWRLEILQLIEEAA